MFSTCCVILGILHDPHHLCSNILAILVTLHVNCCWLSCLSVLLRCCERFIISLVSFCSHLEVILTSTHSDGISTTSRCDGNCATLLTASTWKTQSHLSLMCSLTQLTCVSQLWPSTTTHSSVHTHILLRFTCESSVIRMRSMYSSVSVTALDLPREFSLSLCVSHNNAEFLQTTLGLVLRLVDLVLISGLLCILHHPINFGLRQFPFHPFPSLSGQQASFSMVLVHDSSQSWSLQAVLQDLATELQVSHSEPSTHSPAVATFALHLPFLGPSRIARQSREFKVSGFPQTALRNKRTSTTQTQSRAVFHT